MAALIAKTLVEEARRTWRSIGISTIVRPFNAWAVEEMRKKEKDRTKRERIERARGSKRIALFTLFLNEFRKKVSAALREVTAEKYKTIFKSIETSDNKASAKEVKEIEDDFLRGLKKPVKMYKAEQESGYNPTAVQKGQVLLKDLSKKAGREHLIDAELKARQITTQMKDFVTEYGENADLATISINDKKKYIKLDEARRMVHENEMLTVEDALKKATKIKPISTLLLEFLAEQHRIEQAETNNESSEQNE